jgi:tripartite-type tricarboxylate transporter receptor subunit TctC
MSGASRLRTHAPDFNIVRRWWHAACWAEHFEQQRPSMPHSRLPSFASLAAASWLLIGPAWAGEDFYEGKTIKVMMPTAPGGTYTLYANLFNQRLRQHLPGSPALVLQFMPGGSAAMNYLYNIAPKDGLTIGMLEQTAAITQVVTPDAVRYDVRNFSALGLVAQLNGVLTVANKTPVHHVEELKQVPVTLSAPNQSNYQYIIPQLMNRYLSTKFKVITGYQGTAETTLAMSRGEVDGVFTSWLTVKQQRSGGSLNDDSGRVLLQVGYTSEPDLDAPLLQTLAPDEKAHQAFAFVAAVAALSRGFIAPPGVPKERLAILRAAFAATLEDPELQASLVQRNLPFSPLTWQVQQQIMDSTAATPRELVQ